MASSLIMQSLTIKELEEASGVPRSTIYYYVREGLLPQAQKAAASRAIYTESHLDLLGEIARLQAQGLSLRAVKARLAPRVAAARTDEVDLVAEQNEQTRQTILTAAARLFARKGYKRTRIADIIAEAGVTPPVFYSHFPSKQDVFVESFGVFVGWMRGFLESRLVDEPDPAARDLARVHGYFGVQALSPDLMSLVRSEALQEDDTLRRAVERSYRDMTEDTLRDLALMREASGIELPAADELMAYGLLGGVENVVMRSSWDDTYTTQDVLWTTLCMFLAVQALYSGRLDLRAELERYSGLVATLAESPPPVPPAARALC
jgi:AcrR family transcriptional regulator